jgi:type II secretory pathway pseudopilin PulG
MLMKWQQGFALTTSLIVLVVVGALIAGTVFTTQFETNVALNDAAAAQAQYVAQAGLQKYKAVLFQTFRYNESMGGGTGFQCENSLSNGIDLNRDGAIYFWDNDRINFPQESVLDVNGNVIGTYRVSLLRDPNNDSRITVVSEGQTVSGQGWRQARARAASTFVIRNSAGTEQAVFAGTGHGMKFFNGNTEVFGGVHIVGDENNPDTVVIDTRGNSRILNGYTENDAGNTTSFLVEAARSADNLCASVRVQYGRVVVDGNANFGATNNPLLTVAVGDDLNDLQAANTDCNAKKMNVCAHSVGIFDLWESAPVFPMLDESPGTELCPVATWRTCIRQEADADGMRITLTAEGASTVQLTGLS